jgi:hypothetical protein
MYVHSIESGAPGDDVRVDEALAVKESKQHLLGPAQLDLGLYRAQLPLLDPLLGMFFFV